MSPTKGRRYRDYKWVSLVASVKCPDRNVMAEGFPGDRFAFFVEDGFFCIESKKNGAVVETAPANVREARRKTDAELKVERDAEFAALTASEKANEPEVQPS